MPLCRLNLINIPSAARTPLSHTTTFRALARRQEAMPAQKRPAPPDDPPADTSSSSPPPPLPSTDGETPLPEMEQGGEPPPQPPPPNQAQETLNEEKDDSDAEGGSQSPPSDAEKDELVLVKLADIRKEVQCPICLGIIRKTRTVMECLHRFCRECIDKSMRLGNNECPACRTHCASRRSLRADPNYDALIAVLYPDIDKYEEEELAFHEEEKNRNRKIQASIAETLRRQTEALGKRRSTAKATAAAFVRRSQGNFRSSYLRGRGRNGGHDAILVGSDEDEDANGNDGGRDSSTAEDCSPDVRQRRYRRWAGPRSSPARTGGNADIVSEENDDLEVTRENLATSPLRAEMLAWGKGGARSQTRHGNTSGVNGRHFKGGRVNKLAEHLRNLDENDDEFDVHLTLIPLDEEHSPSLQRPYLCCRPTISIRHICQFIALQTSLRDEEIEILARKSQSATLPITSSQVDIASHDPSAEFQVLALQESLATVYTSFNQSDLVLLYRLKLQS